MNINLKLIIIFVVSVAGLIVGYRFLISTGNAYSKSDQRPIICFGDSITEGNRFFKKTTYPHILGELLGEEVINEGISGETSRQALKRIQKDVLDKNPKLVIVQFGGNDPPNRILYTETLSNNDLIVEQIINAGVEVVLLLAESTMLKPKYLNGFREIAEKHNVILIDNAIDDIIKDPKLTYDGLHPTAQGNEIMAKIVFEALLPLQNID